MNNFITVILADTNEVLRNQIEVELKSRGNVKILASVSSGIELIEKATKEIPDIIITDSVLTKLDGLSALTALKNLSKKPKVIVTSSFLSSDITSECNALNINYFMLKPFNNQSLVDKVFSCANNFTRIDNNNAELDLEIRITNLILELGIPTHIKGYQYLREALLLCVNDIHIITAITKILYPSIAKSFHTTPSRVERAIRHAIDITWSRGDLDVLQKVFNITPESKKQKPTNSELISLLADKLRLEIKIAS